MLSITWSLATLPSRSARNRFSIFMAGVTGAIEPSGELNPGTVSINGQRESANGFYVNGGSVQEHMKLDSVARFAGQFGTNARAPVSPL